MQEYNFENSVVYLLGITAQAYRHALNRELSRTEVSFRQAQLIGCLVFHGDLPQSELARRMMIEPASSVGILNRMESCGWIVRRKTALLTSDASGSQ